MNNRSVIAALLCALTALATALPAYAGNDADLPPLTPKGQFLVTTFDDATTSSKCIGNPITPLCAVETILTCFYREDIHLCQIGMDIDFDPGFLGNPDRPQPEFDESMRRIQSESDQIYRIVRREVLTDRRFPWQPRRALPWRPGELNEKIGDIRIDVVEKECPHKIPAAYCSTRPSWTHIAYIVRRQGNHWVVITWGDPNDYRG